LSDGTVANNQGGSEPIFSGIAFGYRGSLDRSAAFHVANGGVVPAGTQGRNSKFGQGPGVKGEIVGRKRRTVVT